MAESPQKLKPIVLYDHLPGILAGYPALLFLLMALFSYLDWFDTHMMFWIGLSIMILWYVAFRFNLPKNKFIMLVGLLGTFVGIPVVLELARIISPFSWAAGQLGQLAPAVNTGAWVVESGLTVNRVGGKGERFELIGLKTENEPLDYLELFLCGVGSLSLKTRMNKPIFKMDRVIGLYPTIWFPFFKSKLSRIEEMLSYQGKVVSVDKQDRLDAAEAADGADDDELYDDEAAELDEDGTSQDIK